MRRILEETPDPLCPLRWTNRLARFQEQTIAHLWEINTFAIHLRRAIGAAEGMQMRAWLDDDQLSRLKDQGLFSSFTPDGFCLVEVQTGSGMKLVPIFVEIDRRTETLKSSGFSGKDWATKIQRYGSYFAVDFRSDPFLEHIGITRDLLTFLDSPRVLTQTVGDDRVPRMITTTAESGGKGTYLYTERSSVRAEWGSVLGSIWHSTDAVPPYSISLEDILRRPLK